MRATGPWIAFLVTLFALVGLCGMFASYATAIPLERGVARSALLDRVLQEGGGADAAPRLEAVRPLLGTLGPAVLDGPGSIQARVAAARIIVRDEQRRESDSIAYRTRLMLGIVTALSAGLGGGILVLARRSADRETMPLK